MEVYLFNGNGKTDITSIVSSVTIAGEYRSCCRTLDFGIIKSQTDKNTHTVPINLGNNIKIVENGKVIFHGIVWGRNKSSDANEIDFSCKDYGIYLTKNRHSYKFKGITPENIVKKVCADFGIKVGTIAQTGKSISRNFMGVSLYDIIKTCYTLANDKKYLFIFEGDKLNVVEKGVIACDSIESSINLLTVNVSETLNSMTNRVSIFDKDDKLIKNIENANDIKLYGLMSEYIKVQDSKEDYNLKANKMLSGIEQKIGVTNFGDAQYMTGKIVIVKDPYTGLNGKFYIDADEHNWKNGIYTNKLTLNFQNLMDEAESGSER
ncbi:MAG: hypothetical protein RR744_10855 [Cellulosilyticaceae bacterium]